MTLLGCREYHRFDAAGAPFIYLVPSAGVFRLDHTAATVLEELEPAPVHADELVARLAGRFPEHTVRAALDELTAVRAIGPVAQPEAPPPRPLPRARVPLTTLVMNVTSKCNLACTYCYEYGADRIVADGTTPRFMNEDTARASVDFLFRQAGDQPVVHLTFFGGETLLNFKVLRAALAYARERAAVLGKTVDASLTTNGTLLRPEIIEWVVEHDVGVTISIDGRREQQDRFRVFHDGRGSYDVILPGVRELLARHRRPVGARVTLTRHNLDIIGIYRHLFEEVGFWEVGFAPVTTSWQRDFAIQDKGFHSLVEQFRTLAWEFAAAVLAGRRHGFSNVRDTLEEIHKGQSKAYPCGAGFGLMGVATDGTVALCHRFAGSPAHTLGTVRQGIDQTRQSEFLARHHVDAKTDCRTCWARPLCAGGCYHEAHTRYGTTEAPNLHYCEWIRSWTDTCLRVYGTLARHRPDFLDGLRSRSIPSPQAATIPRLPMRPTHEAPETHQREGTPHRGLSDP